MRKTSESGNAMKTNAQSIRDRISKCATSTDCDNLDTALNRLYVNGAISRQELARYDSLVCDRRDAISNIQSK